MAIQPQQLKKLEKLAKVLDGGELELFKQLTDLEERVDTVAEQLPALREAKDGVDGVDGYTPVKGKDYFDGYTPIKGVDYFDGVNGRDGKDSTVPGPRGPRGDVGPRGPAGKNGDIKDLSPQEIRDSLELLQGEERLNVSAIDGLEKEVTDRAISIVDNRTSYLINRINNLPTSSSSSGSTAWGGITGTLSDQTDLQNALNAKSDTTHTHTGVYEPANATLTALAGLNTTAGIVSQTGTDTFTKRTITGTTNQISVSNGDGVSGNPTLSLPQDIHTGASPTFAGVTAPTGRTASFTVAASDATAKEIAQADYVCDGTADNVQIQQAIDALPSTGGKVTLTSGTFNLAATLTVDIDKGFTLEGAGYSTILSVNNSTNIYAITFSPSVSGIWATFRDFKINCNGANQTTGGGGIYAAGAIECLFDNIWIHRPFNYGMYLYQIGAGSFGHHNKIINCIFDEGASSSGEGVGILMESSDENRIHNCEFQFMGGAAGTVAPAAIIDKTGLNTITNCVFVGGFEGIRFQDSSRGQVANCTFDSVVRNNIYLKGTEMLIVNNEFYKPNDGATNNTYNILRIDYYGHNVIASNLFRTNETASKTRSCIHDDGAGYNVYSGNKFKVEGAVGTSTVDITSTNNVITGNVGIANDSSGGGATPALDNLASVAINTSLISDTDSTDDLGSSSKYWANTYTDRLYLNSTAYLDGGTAGTSAFSGGVNIVTPDTRNVKSLYIEQNDSTNSPMAVYIKNAGSGEAFRFEQNAVLGTSKTCFAIYSNQAHVGSDSYLLKMENTSSSSTIPMSYMSQSANAPNLVLNNNHTGGDAHGIQMRFPSGASAKFLEFKNNWAVVFTVNNDGKIYTAGEIEIDGALNHDGTTVGFFGTTPTTKPSAYTPTNVTADRSFDANSTTLDEVADVLGTLIADLQRLGLVG